MLDKYKEQQALLDSCAQMEAMAADLAEQARSVRSQIMHLHVRHRAVSSAIHMLESGMPRAEICRALQERFGIKRRTSYNIINEALNHRIGHRGRQSGPAVAALPRPCGAGATRLSED